MPTLDRDGVPIHYDVTGPAGASARLLLSHGYAATSSMWAPNLAALSRDRQVITWDIRGHGRSGSPADRALYSHELSVGDMAAVMDAAGVTSAAIGGLSLGGYLSLAFYLRFPERVEALLLFDTGPGYRKEEARARWNAMAERQAAALESKGLSALSTSREVEVSEHRSAAGLAMAARGILAQSDSSVLDSLESVKVPTLVLVGSEDEPFLTAADVMASKIPGAQKAVIPGAGHAANIDQPAAFDDAVSSFLDGI